MYTPGIREEKEKSTALLAFALYIISILLDSLVLQYLYKAFILPDFTFMPDVKLNVFLGVVLIYKLLNTEKEVSSQKKHKEAMMFLQQNKAKVLFTIIFWPGLIFAIGWVVNNLYHLK